jgi:PAS domain S-box-containing protein
MSDPIRILILEDFVADAILAERELRRSLPDFVIKVVDSEESFIEQLEALYPDIIISDYQLPSFDGLSALRIAIEKSPDTPFIVFTGSMNEDTAVNCMRAGATDYVIKEHLKRLGPAVINALEQKNVRLEKQKAEELLKARETMYHLMFARNPQPMLVYDSLSFSILEVNQSAVNLYGYTEDEFLSLTIKDIRPPEDIPDLVKVTTKPRDDYFPAQEWRHLKKNGELFNVEIVSHGIIFNDRAARHVLIKDITKQKKAEEFLRQNEERLIIDLNEKKKLIDELIVAKKKAEESDQLKTAFLQNISHEIRTPLNAIIGFATFLGDPGLDDEKRKHFLEIIDASSNQLLSIISGILSLATLEAGQAQLQENKCNINELLKNVYEQFNVTFSRPEISFLFQPGLKNEKAVVFLDQVKLMQVLVNLIENAFKFTSKGSIRYGYHIRNKWVEFFVSDTGIGIVPEMQNLIFERFRQADNSPTRRYGGAGLGLALSKGYVEMMGGKIKVVSDSGKGSLFTFTLPYKPAGNLS